MPESPQPTPKIDEPTNNLLSIWVSVGKSYFSLYLGLDILFII